MDIIYHSGRLSGTADKGQCRKAVIAAAVPQTKEFPCVMLTRGAGHTCALSGLRVGMFSCPQCLPGGARARPASAEGLLPYWMGF